MNQTASKPATSADTSDALKVLFGSGIPFQRGVDPNMVALVYCEALRGYTLEAIQAGISKFLRGECDGVSQKFIPTPPELARIVRTTIVPQRVPQIAHYRQNGEDMDGRAKARMRLKMPMLGYAWGNEARTDELAAANNGGLSDMIMLAMKWGIAIPDELNDQTDGEWNTARNRSLDSVDRNPPEFIVRMRQAAAKFSGHPVIAENVTYDEWRRLSASRQVPAGAVWSAALATIFGPKAVAAREAA